MRHIAADGESSHAYRASGTRDTRSIRIPATASPIHRQNWRQTDKTGSRLCISAHPNRTISRKTLDFPPSFPPQKKLAETDPIVVQAPRSDIASIRTESNTAEQDRTRSASYPTEQD